MPLVATSSAPLRTVTSARLRGWCWLTPIPTTLDRRRCRKKHIEDLAVFFLDCAIVRNAVAEHKPLPALPSRPGQPQRTCSQQFFRGLPETAWSPELNAKLLEIAQTKVAMYDAYLSEMEQAGFDEAYLQQHRRPFGSRPIRVLTSGNHGVGHLERKPPDTPERIKYQQEITRAQARWRGLSS